MTFEDINRFWLNEVGPSGWYNPTSMLDDQIRARFQQAWTDAARLTDGWRDDARGTLAGIILTDQFPRNMFRGDPRSYVTDKLARDLAQHAIEAGHDMATPEPARQFFYMPFMHSEDMGDQNRAVDLFTERMPGDNLRHAELHRQVVARFGRFPWRNAELGRPITTEETAFLTAGGYGALVQGRLSLDGS